MNKVQLTSPDQILSAARYKACYDHMPYLSIALHNCIPMWKKGLGTIGISAQMHLLIDPVQWTSWYKEYGVGVLGWVLIHEVQHVLRGHSDRAKRIGVTHENKAIINACQDAEINDDFPGDPKACLPKGFCWLPEMLNNQPRGKMWEEYYAGLPVNKQNQKYIPGHENLGEDRPDLKDGGSLPEEGGQCGSGATGIALPGEPQQDTGSGQTQDKNGSEGQEPGKAPPSCPGRSLADIERIKQQVAEAVQNHEHTNGRGSVPAGISRWSDQQLTPPVIPWRQQLRRACRFAVAQVRGQQDYDYTRPSRRQAGVGQGYGKPVLPRMFSPVPRVVVGVDTSGSMSSDDLGDAMSEMDGLIKSLGNIPVDLLTCDAAVHVATKVTSVREATKHLIGGGGTDFVPVFEKIQETKGGRPDILVILTDGDGTAPTVNPLPRTHIVWVLLGDFARTPYDENGNEISYGTFITVPPQDQRADAA